MENFYVLYGNDKAGVQYECKQLIKEWKDSDIIKYDMNTTPLTEVLDDAKTVGMFSEKKIIILEDAYFLSANKNIDSIEELETYLEHYNKDNILIFQVYSEKIDTRKKINKSLAKHKIIEVKKKDEVNLKKIIEEKLTRNGYKMEDIAYFIKCVGTVLPNIENELDKLMMYKIEDKIICNEDIDKVSVLTNEEEIFSLTDAIVAKDTLKSLNLLETFLNKNYDEIQIIMLLASQFRFFFQVKRLMNKNKSESEIARTLEVNPYRVKFTTKKLYAYTETTILNYIKKIAKMDHDIKLGLMDKHLALELFIATNNE